MRQAVKKLNGRHFVIIDRHLMGWSNVQIAESLNMTPQQVSIVLNSASTQYEITRRRNKLDARVDDAVANNTLTVDKAIKQHVIDAAERLGFEVNNLDASPSDRIKAATEILDRGGAPKVMRTESKNVNLTIDAKDAALIAETLSMDK